MVALDPSAQSASLGSSALPLRIEHLWVRDLRNIETLEFEPAPRLNVISGDNGQGKTSLLEALYLVATTRSFRADKLVELVRQGAEHAVVRGRIVEGTLGREQRAVVAARSRSFLLDGKRPKELAGYALRTPVVLFHPGDLTLVSGPATQRRTLLDRVTLFVEPISADDRLRYSRALKERQRVLDERGPGAPELEAYETLLAEHGARLCRFRRRAAASLVDALIPAFRRVGATELELVADYRPGGCDDVDLFRTELAARRAQDTRRGSASFGPHRDDLDLALDGRAARRHASQGQQRIIALALKLAELNCIRAARGVEPALLLDDVSSELDPTRTGAVYEFLRQAQNQVFVTTTRPELLVTDNLAPGERADWTLAAGRLTHPQTTASTAGARA